MSTEISNAYDYNGITLDLGGRIRAIRERLCYGNNNEFAQRLGIKASQASSLCNNRKRTVSQKTFKKIMDAFPELNIEWFRYGRGKMLTTDRDVDSTAAVGNMVVDSVSGSVLQSDAPYIPNTNREQELLNEVQSLRQQVVTMQQQLSILIETNSRLMGMMVPVSKNQTPSTSTESEETDNNSNF